MGFLLHHSVDESAQRRPDHEAFRFDGSALTYQGLAEASDRLARFLVENGARPHDRIGIYMNKSLRLPVALYGILKAGAAYVPIDPGAPVARVRFILKDCGIRTLITDQAHAAKAGAAAEDLPEPAFVLGAHEPKGGPFRCRFVPWDVVELCPAKAPDVPLVEQDLAYVMYTSGSTGVPKGLMHTHLSGGSYARFSGEFYGVRPEDRLGNHSPLHFDMSTFEYLTGPLRGATTVVIPEEITMFPVSLAELIESERLTFWYSVPLALIQLLERGGVEQRDIRTMRWVLFGGEPLAPKYVERLSKAWPGARFSNSYGPAEVNQCTAYNVPEGPIDLAEPIPIGPVWPGAQGLVVDDQDREVEPGKSGELLIRSTTMMAGYWAQPDLNRTCFYRRRAFPNFEEVFYRTGDIVRDRGDGALLFLGRRDRLVKVRGYRVELDEVEAVFSGLPEVAEAAAVAVRDVEDETVSIAAAVILRQPGGASAEALKRTAAQHLPPYAVPSRLEIRETMPRTGSGKIDRTALAREIEGSPTA